VARLLHAGGAGGAAHRGRARAAPGAAVLRRVPRDAGARAVGVRAGAHALSRPQGVPRRGRAHEGGPREHGLLTGGAGAAPRSPGRRARGEPADPAAAPGPDDQVRAQAHARGDAAARDPGAPKERLRRPAGTLVPRRPGAPPPGPLRARRDPPRGPVPAGHGRAPPHRARGRASRPSEEAVHAPGLPALGLAVPSGVKRRLLDWLACPACRGAGTRPAFRLAAAFGAKQVTAPDPGPAVDAAAQNTADLDNVHVVQGDLTRPPFRLESVDLIYSIGLLHHLPEPEAGFRALSPLLVPGGRFVAWLYAREGNGWVLALVDPARRLTSRLPLRLVSGLAGVVTVPLWIALRVLYAPARTRPRLARTLPYASYLTDLAPFPFREVHSIAFDHFLAPVAHYMARARVERCFAEGGLTLESLRWHHANSWAASGTRPEAP